MKIIPGNARDWSDDEVQHTLRSYYAAPTNDAYWSALEHRIMDRVRGESAIEWWSHFPGWVRYGLATAAAAVLVAGVAQWQASAAQERMAYRELDNAAEVPVLSERPALPQREREQTLRYLLTH
jgi:hypothetical protein